MALSSNPPTMSRALAIKVVSLCLIFFIGLSFSPKKPKPLGDLVFFNEAVIIATVIKGELGSEAISFSHAIVPTLFYVIPSLIMPSNSTNTAYAQAYAIWNCLFFIMSSLLYTYVFCRLSKGEGTWIFLILFFILPIHAYYHLGVSGATIAFLSLALFLYYSTAQTVNWWASALCLGTFIACRPNGVIAIPLLLGLGLYWKNYKLSFIAIGALLTFFLYSGIGSSLQQADTQKKDKVAFLFEQLYFGQYFLRKEPTDWSFFNAEYRPQSLDYQERTQGMKTLEEKKQSGVPIRKAYIECIWHELSTNPLYSLRLIVTKAIHGHSLHLGSTIPGNCDLKYIRTHKLLFSVNIMINIVNWAIIFLAGLFLWRKDNAIRDYWPLWVPWLSLTLFNCISASEQRYIFPAKAMIIILASLFFTMKTDFPKNKST